MLQLSEQANVVNAGRGRVGSAVRRVILRRSNFLTFENEASSVLLSKFIAKCTFTLNTFEQRWAPSKSHSVCCLVLASRLTAAQQQHVAMVGVEEQAVTALVSCCKQVGLICHKPVLKLTHSNNTTPASVTLQLQLS